MILAEIPVPLCSAERIVQAVLRGNPSAFACASSETIPAVISALPISRILDACRAFTSVSVRSGVLFPTPAFPGALTGSRAGKLCMIIFLALSARVVLHRKRSTLPHRDRMRRALAVDD